MTIDNDAAISSRKLKSGRDNCLRVEVDPAAAYSPIRDIGPLANCPVHIIFGITWLALSLILFLSCHVERTEPDLVRAAYGGGNGSKRGALKHPLADRPLEQRPQDPVIGAHSLRFDGLRPMRRVPIPPQPPLDLKVSVSAAVNDIVMHLCTRRPKLGFQRFLHFALLARSARLVQKNEKGLVSDGDQPFLCHNGAGDEVRTRDLFLGKEAFYH